VEALRLALTEGAQLEDKSRDGLSAAMMAAQCGSTRCLQELLRLGALFCLRPQDFSQASAALSAIENFQLDALRVIEGWALSHPAQLTTQEQWSALDREARQSLLDMAASQGFVEAVPILSKLCSSHSKANFYSMAAAQFIRRGRVEMAAALWLSLEQPHAREHVKELLGKVAASATDGAHPDHGVHFQAFMAWLEKVELAACVPQQEDVGLCERDARRL
jgi:hypothetical protein